MISFFVCLYTHTHHWLFISHSLTYKCKHDVVSLLTQPPSPPEEPAPPPPSKDKDSNASTKPPGKGKAGAGGQQVVV